MEKIMLVEKRHGMAILISDEADFFRAQNIRKDKVT